jgi:hypothetical protein
MSYNIYTGLLKMFNEFQENTQNLNLSYDFCDKNLQELKIKYSLDEKAGNGDDLSKAINLLNWVSENIHHDGCYNYEKMENAINLLDDYFQKGKDYGINCRALSRTLTGCLLSIGIKARTLFMMPASPYDNDNHVVTHAYIKKTKQWILLDPTYNTYVMNKEKKILNVFEIRNLLANQENIIFSDKLKFSCDECNIDEIKTYYAKNLFYLKTDIVSKFNEMDDGRITVCIALKNYNVNEWNIYNLEYRIRSGQMEEWFEDQLNYFKSFHYDYITPEKLNE